MSSCFITISFLISTSYFFLFILKSTGLCVKVVSFFVLFFVLFSFGQFSMHCNFLTPPPPGDPFAQVGNQTEGDLFSPIPTPKSNPSDDPFSPAPNDPFTRPSSKPVATGPAKEDVPNLEAVTIQPPEDPFKPDKNDPFSSPPQASANPSPPNHDPFSPAGTRDPFVPTPFSHKKAVTPQPASLLSPPSPEIPRSSSASGSLLGMWQGGSSMCTCSKCKSSSTQQGGWASYNIIFNNMGGSLVVVMMLNRFSFLRRIPRSLTLFPTYVTLTYHRHAWLDCEWLWTPTRLDNTHTSSVTKTLNPSCGRARGGGA